VRPSKRWRRHAEVYRFFAEGRGLDFSEEAAQAAYAFESQGVRSDLTRNGYAVGKHWANVQVDEWRQDIGTYLKWSELLEDAELEPVRWWVQDQCVKHLREKVAT